MTDKFEHASANAKGWLASIEEMNADIAKLEACTNDHDDAEQRIHESVLSVQVRSGWYSPGESLPSSSPDEYEILLSTGGPALRIWGKLDGYSQPTSAELQMQDWGTPWTRYPCAEGPLLDFAGHFWFGE